MRLRPSRNRDHDGDGPAGEPLHPGNAPTTGSAAASDLDAMPAASGERGPFVLVGHSYGGDVIRLYASAHPKDTAGLVLVDALSEDLPNRLTPEQSANLEKLISPETQGLLGGAVHVQRRLPELRSTTTTPAVPVVVLSAGGHYIHREQPQVVVDAITQVASRARGTPGPT